MEHMEKIKPTALYQGIDSVTGALMAGKIIEGGLRESGGKSDTIIDCCMSSEELSKNVTTGMSFELGIGPFSLGLDTSGSREFSGSSFTAYLYISSFYIKSVESHENPILSDDLLPKDGQNTRYFTLRNGDSYVSSISRGASYHAIYSFTFNSLQEKNKKEVKAELSGLIKFVSIGVEASQKIEEFKRKFNASSTLLQRIHGPGGMEHPKPEQMYDFARKFPEIAKEKEEFDTLNWGVYPNEIANKKLEEGPFKKVIENRKAFEDKRGLLTVIRTQNEELKLMENIYKIYKSASHPGGYKKDKKFAEVLKESNEAMGKVSGWLRSFLQEPTKKVIIEEKIPVLDRGYPVLNIEVKDGVRFGSRGPEENFNPLNILFGGYRGFMRKTAVINGISVVQIDGMLPDLPSGTRLATLTIKYTGIGGKFYSPKHTASKDIKTVSSRITRISGKSGSYIDSIFFHSEGQTIGAGGPGGNIPFEFFIQDDWFLLYLRGYQGSILDWFAPVIARFKEAGWEKIEG